LPFQNSVYGSSAEFIKNSIADRVCSNPPRARTGNYT
jgi:hypothetical protein